VEGRCKMEKYKVIAYIADWAEWEAHEIDGNRLTHINYAFATIEKGRVVDKVLGQEMKNIHKLKNLKARYSQLNMLISIGGWGADGFSDAALTRESRKVFADSAIGFMKRYEFDGIDIDWEYPCSSEAGIVARPEDKRNFTLLLKELRERLNRQEEQDDRKYYLTIAAGAGQYFIDGTEMCQAQKYLDYINLMTYDYSSGNSRIAGHHTNLFPSVMYPGSSCCESVELFLKEGIPASRLLLGAASYGRSWSGVCGVNHGLGQPGDPGCRAVHTGYGYMHDHVVDKNGFTRYWDNDARAPFLYDGNIFISYDDEESVQYKTEYVKDKGLGGMFFWEYSSDKPGRLLKVMYDNLIKGGAVS